MRAAAESPFVPEWRGRVAWWRPMVAWAIFGTFLGALPALADPKPDKFVIGGLLSLSGPLGINGVEARKGLEFAIAEHGGKLLGIAVEAHWEDTESKPQVAVQKATGLIGQGAQFLVGSVGSGETLAIMKLAAVRKIPMLVPLSSDPSITGSARNPYVFRTTQSGDSLTRILEQYLRATNARDIYGVVADYGVARASWIQLKGDLTAQANIRGESFPSLGQGDFSVVIQQLVHSGATVAVVALGGNDAINFLKQAEEVHLRQKVKLVGMNIGDSAIAAAAGPGALGVVSALRYDYSLDNAWNNKFVQAFHAHYGEWPSALAGDAYDGLSWWLDVIEKTGSVRKEDWMKAFAGASWDHSILGSRMMRECDHQAQSPGFIAEVVAGNPPAPPYTMKILQTMTAQSIATPCP